ncbi:ABC-type nitrate/sulfonate/bicarbonate transport system, substrate-binding protein [Microlunatus sagamiharensis]|uniref:Thiamine pyrimidine synthase n=1 Tax=Microlunatus sagamiharensis TaxID=546874 RepID=A0A1H2N094_9ACTN|nr:ABC transporter substrate-binding protein [Microlunatus sagamiharensis]SDU98186.1 ABC-type nitrate/sulfonate/bicarbonate transport system, substrate-binding protein [Microlunatus sagamiharensis]
MTWFEPTSTRRRFLASSGLGALALGALAACGGGSAAPAGSASSSAAAAPSSVAPGTYGKLSLQLSWIKNIEFAGEFFADSKGYYTDAGFESVDLVTGPVDSADALVVAGTVDVGLSAPDATARLVAEQGAPLKIIGATFQKNPFCILSLEEGKPIRTIADLAGKTIGIQAGTNQSIFEGLLKANNVDPSTIKTTVVQYEPTPLTEKKIDGFMAYLTNEPFIVKSKGFTPVTLSFADNGLPLASETFVVLQQTIEEDRDKLKAFLTAEIKGWKDAVADPAAGAKLAAETYGKGLGLDVAGQTEQLEAQLKLIVSDDTKANGLFTLTPDFQEKIVAAIGALGTTITAADLFDMSLLDEVYAADASLKA